MVLNFNADNLQYNYNLRGSSARTCVQLSRMPEQELQEDSDKFEQEVSRAIATFVTDPQAFINVFQVNLRKVFYILFSIQPRDQTPSGRMVPIAEVSTNRIKEMISYAAASVTTQERFHFYQTISSQPLFKACAGQMFKRFVLSWLASLHKGSLSLHCTPHTPHAPHTLRTPCIPATPPVLEISAYGEEYTYFFSSLAALKEKAGMDKPLCLLPTSQTLVAVDAIILTKSNIITVQVTISRSHSTKKDGLKEIKKSLPHSLIKNCKWCHVFITDDYVKAESLRGQTLSDLPNNIFIYSVVFDVGQLDITHAHLEAFDKKKVSVFWLHVISAYWGITVTSNLNMLAKIVWTLTMSDDD
jgi:hypothetical protein